MNVFSGAAWRKSSYSGSQSDCVEVAFAPAPAAWRKSSHSGTQSECVEVAADRGLVGVRDTKDRDGGTLTVPAASWQAFLATLPR
ncbi:DUF397 domain-containing protein [Amycolatopsis antarctica]|uniref:DUF397 domain-containing protein n=1 Tax=Amycolatopsis antarctica TaxID=1854586 RepID=A0A263DB69_9PSEU|nr:DUF397 domain-containing protein [Amycolatopsis antarctica]OZM74757.1 DUF397 domain-containing protein [Amycolatopsis antarctica]